MIIQKFFNHLLYTYSWLDRLLFSNPLNPQGRESANNIGLTTLSFVLAGYTVGGLNVLRIIIMEIFQIIWLESKFWLIVITCLLLSFELSFVKEGPEHEYLKEFMTEGKSDSIKWGFVAFLLFIGSAWIGLYVLIS